MLPESLLGPREGPGAGPTRVGRPGAAWGLRSLGASAPPSVFSVSAAYWRFWLCVSVVYELFLIFILFQVRGFSWLHEWGASGGCEVAEEALSCPQWPGQSPWPRFRSVDNRGCACICPLWHVFGKVVSGRRLETHLFRKSRIRICCRRHLSDV